MRLITKAGQIVEVPDAEVPQKYLSGEYGFPGGTERVHVVDRYGRVGTVPVAEASAAFRDRARLASGDEVERARVQTEHAGPAGAAVAGAEGAARGLTLGGSDILAMGGGLALGGKAGAEKVREHLRGYKEGQPGPALAGEVGGALGGALLGEGPAGAVAGLEGLAERGAAKLGAEGAEGLLGRTVQGAIRRGVGGVVGGGIYGGAQEINESVLEDKPLTAEHFIGAVGHGAFYGGLIGGVAGAGSELVPAASRAVLGKIGARDLLGRAASDADTMAERYAVDAFEPSAAMRRELEEMPGGVKAAGRQAIDDGLVRFGQRVGSEDALARVRGARVAADAALRSAVEGVEAPGLTAEHVTKALEDLHPPPATPSAPEEQRLIQSVVDQWHGAVGEGATPASLRQVGDLQRSVASSELGLTPLGRRINDSLGDLIKAQASKAGLGKEIVEATERLRRVEWLERAAEEAVDKPRPTGIRPYAVAAGLLSLNPAGIAKGIALGMGAQAVRERGAASAAIILDRLSSIGGLARIARKGQEEMGDAVDGFLSRESRPRPRMPRFVLDDERNPNERFKQAADHVRAIAASPAAAQQELYGSLRRLDDHTPGVAAEAVKVLQRGLTYLMSKLPAQSVDPNSPTPHLEEARINSVDRDAFLDAWETVQHPMKAVHELEDGHVSVDTIEAIKAVYPRMYKQLRETVQERLASREEPPSYQQLVQLSILFDLPTDSTLTPEFIRATQNAYISEQRQRVGMAQPNRQNLTLKSVRNISSPADAVLVNELPRDTA